MRISITNDFSATVDSSICTIRGCKTVDLYVVGSNRPHGLVNQSIPNLRRKSQLNDILTTKNGSPDLLAISLYWDILRFRYWSAAKNTLCSGSNNIPRIRTSYEELAKRLKCSVNTVKVKVKKLEALGLIQRSFEHSKEKGFFNNLVIYVLKDTPHFTNNYGVAIEDCTIVPQTNHEYITHKYNKSIKAQSQDQSGLQVGGYYQNLVVQNS